MRRVALKSVQQNNMRPCHKDLSSLITIVRLIICIVLVDCALVYKYKKKMHAKVLFLVAKGLFSYPKVLNYMFGTVRCIQKKLVLCDFIRIAWKMLPTV